jgi:dipeptidyl aminopeptidase/acylaminoacyl peptidase
VTLTYENLCELSFFGAPSVCSTNPEVIVYAKANINGNGDQYESHLVLSHLSTGEESPLFPGQKNDSSPRWSPDGRKIAFLRNYELWVFDFESHDSHILTPGVKVMDFVWSPTGRKIAYVSRKQELNPIAYSVNRFRYKFDGEGLTLEFTQVYAVDVESAKISQISSRESDHRSPCFSLDGEKLSYVVEYAGRDDYQKHPIIETYHFSSVKREDWDPGVSFIDFLLPINKDTFLGIGKRNTEHSVELDKLFYAERGKPAEWVSWGIDVPIGYSILSDTWRTGINPTLQVPNQGERVFFAGTERGNQSIFSYHSSSGEFAKLPIPHNVIAFDIVQCDDQDCQLVYVADSFDKPSEIYLTKWDFGSGLETRQLTKANQEAVENWPKIQVAEYEYVASDGLQIHGWLVEQTGEMIHGTVLSIHGGPHLSYGNTFTFDNHFLCSQGYRIIFSNSRGSSGYGQSFSNAVIGEWGEKDVSDILGFLEFVEKQTEEVTPRFVMGGSYGGFLVNWIISHDSRFQAAVSERSISNFYSKYGTSDNGYLLNRAEMDGADLWSDEDLIMTRSPIRYAEQMNTPVLLMHGEHDQRCPIEQSEQWFIALKRLGKEVNFIRFPGASHGMASSGRPLQRKARLDAIREWFGKHGRNE